MKKVFLAKPNETLEEHTVKVLRCLNQLLAMYGNHFTDDLKELFKIACQYHDYGKLNELFQQKIILKRSTIDDEMPHGFFSCLFLDFDYLSQKFNPELLSALVTAIHYHHTREDCFFPLDYHNYFEKWLKDNVKQYVKKEINFNPQYLNHLLFRNNGIANNAFVEEKAWGLYALIKGILNKCDYAASSGLKQMEISPLFNNQFLYEKIKKTYSKNLKLSQIFMSDNQDKNVILIAPTGSGKTEAALLWAGKSKTFYTLPLKIASNSIYQRIKSYYNYNKVSLLHSDCLTIIRKENNSFDEALEKYYQSKRLSYPITVCTVDQLFKFSFKALGTEHFFATLTYSKVIIDEIQMYSNTILACLIIGLRMLVKLGGKFSIITATMSPLLLELINKYVGEQNYLYKEIITNDSENRHQILIINDNLNYDEISKSSMVKKVLVICNTVEQAKEVYSKLKKIKANTQGLLHSRFVKKDRVLLEKKILEFSNKKSKGVWVSTQIVEVSLDIDFDELHTEMVPADSLLQRLGRCNRKRKYIPKMSNVYIYNNKNGIPIIYDKDLYDISLAELIKYDNKNFSETDKLAYIKNVYNSSKLKKTTYYQVLVNKLKEIKDIEPTEYTKKETYNKFRDMNNVIVIPEEFYNQAKVRKNIEIINQAKDLKDRIEAHEKIMDYTLNIRYKIDDKFRDKYPIMGTDIYRYRGTYNKELGLLSSKEDQNDPKDNFI